jgi:hypothetical protein
MLEMQIPEVPMPPTATPPDPPAPASSLIDGVIARLSEDFHVETDAVAVQASAILRQRYAGARVQSFIPILVERELRALLRAGRAGDAAAS